LRRRNAISGSLPQSPVHLSSLTSSSFRSYLNDVQSVASGKSLGRFVAKPPTESGRHAVSHKKGLGVLHISREEQLERFKQRLDDPNRNWKISDSDYKEREYWDAYTKAFEEVFDKTSKKDAPWYIIPSNHKWFRNLAVSQIVAATLEDLGMQMPKPQVDLEVIRREYH
jgi:hypothetical protein